MDEEILDLLIRGIKNKRCVLFLGPGVFKANRDDTSSIYQKYASSLASKMNGGPTAYDINQQENLHYVVAKYIQFKNEHKHIALVNLLDVKNEFVGFMHRELRTNNIFNLLADLPFCIVINMNPDDTLYKASGAKRKVKRVYYHLAKGQNTQQGLVAADFTDHETVFYNIHGCEESSNSLLLKEKELVDYVSAINYDNTRFPQALRDEFDNSKYYLFLGFDFQPWYMRSILVALGLPQFNEGKITYSTTDMFAPPYVTDFFADELQVHFVPEGDTFAFVDTLHKAYNDRNQQVEEIVTPLRKAKVALLYERNDIFSEDVIDQLNNHLKVLRDDKWLWVWTEAKMLAGGEDKDALINAELMSSDIIIPFVSSGFYGGYANWLDKIKAVTEGRQQRVSVFSLPLKPFDYKAIRQLRSFAWITPKMAGMTKDSLSELSDADLDTFLIYITQRIRDEITRIFAL